MNLQALKSYTPDIIIILGVILYLSPEINKYNPENLFCIQGNQSHCYNTDWDKLGIILIIIGIDILIRKVSKTSKYKFQK